jgi:hypothetical protein
VLSVLGAETERLFVDGHQLLRAWFPQVEDCPIAGVSHLLHLQRPAPVTQGVAACFARHPMTGVRARPRAAVAAAHEGAVGTLL